MSTTTTRPISPAQRGFIAKLIAERNTDGFNLPTEADLDTFTTKTAILVIDALKKLSYRNVAKPSVVVPDVPAGRYAVEDEDGTLKFYMVDRPTQGRWAGYTFLSVQASDEFYPIRSATSKASVLARIALDPKGASARYGQALKICGRCGRTLTDEKSRELGIGPECIKHF